MDNYVKRLKSSFRKSFSQYRDRIRQYEVPMSRMLHEILEQDPMQWHRQLKKKSHLLITFGTKLDVITELKCLLISIGFS